jgi:hypothetical protein
MQTIKTSPYLKAFALAAICLAAFSSSCKKDKDLPIKAAVEVFKPELMKKELEKSFASARGYGFVITQNGQIVETADTGIGRMNPTGGASMPFTIDNYINIASVTKTLTGTTFLMFMRYRDLTLDSPIGPWLPDGWTKNPTMAKLKFRQLLTHTSGIRTSRTAWSNLKTVIANPPEGDNTPTYSNVNFALFRAMLPKMNNLQVYNIEQQGSTADFEQWMSERYIMIIQDNIFKKIGLHDRACVPVPGKTMDMFNEAPSPIASAATDDWTNTCGGGGFYLTVRDLSKIIVYLANTEEFLKNDEKAKMDAELLGWRKGMPVRGGTAYGHGGGLYNDTDASGGVTQGEQGLQTLIMKFPGKVELAIAVNSIGSDWRDMYQEAVDAYNAAWAL